MQGSGWSGEKGEVQVIHRLPGKGHGCLLLCASVSPDFCGFVFLNLDLFYTYSQHVWSVLYVLLIVLNALHKLGNLKYNVIRGSYYIIL